MAKIINHNYYEDMKLLLPQSCQQKMKSFRGFIPFVRSFVIFAGSRNEIKPLRLCVCVCVCVCVRGEREMGRGGGLGESGLKDACHVWILEQETGTGADFSSTL